MGEKICEGPSPVGPFAVVVGMQFGCQGTKVHWFKALLLMKRDGLTPGYSIALGVKGLGSCGW